MNHHSATSHQVKRLDSPAEFKFTGSAGTFEGYAAVFGNVDSGGDVILPGAFQEFAQTKDGKTIVLYQHSLRDPIGKASVSQDSHGLAFRGQLSLEDPTAKKAYGLMKDGVLDSMSIGYDVLPGGEQSKQGKRELSKLKLFEISPVTFGMNDLARIETVKSAMDCAHPSDLVDMLRESLSLSGRQAKAAANVLWPVLKKIDAQDEVAPGQLISLASELNRITTLFKT